jgi:hypothetical protein
VPEPVAPPPEDGEVGCCGVGEVGCCGAGWAAADIEAIWTMAASAAIEAKRVFLSMNNPKFVGPNSRALRQRPKNYTDPGPARSTGAV